MNFYLLYKSLHLIAVISWMAGLLYLPRIFVYHSENKKISQSETFKVMERKLIQLHYDACNDFVLVVWFVANSFFRLFYIFRVMDAN